MAGKGRVAPSIERPTLEYFAYRGPHRVASGPLDPTGLPGLVYAPESGRDLPVVAFGHGWLQPVRRYAETFAYLASWRIVVVTPNTQVGPLGSAGSLGRDLRDAVAAATAGRIGRGRIRVDPTRAGVMGHSMGGAAAVLASAADPSLRAVLTLTASEGSPSAVAAAARVRVPGLHLVGDEDRMAGEGVDSDGARIAAAWAGPSSLRIISGVGHLGLPEGSHWSTALIGSTGVRRAQQVTRQLAAAFFLRHLADQAQLADELDEAAVKGTTVQDLAGLRAGTG